MEYLIYSSWSESYYLAPFKGVTKDKSKAHRYTKEEIENDGFLTILNRSEHITIIEI
jgi:hypothetical protein